MKTKLVWVDNLKVLGILAVILGHISSPIGKFIFSWHMPLFFMIAGFFLKSNLTLKNFIIKNFKRLMVPYFIFSVLGLCMETVKRYVLHRDSLNYIHEIKGIFVWMDMASLKNTYAFVLWFLPALFFVKIIWFVIEQKIKKMYLKLIVVALLFVISFYIQLPFGLDNAMNVLPFLLIGNIYYNEMQAKKYLKILPMLGAVLFLVFDIPALDIANKIYDNIVINLFFSISVIYTFILILKKIKYTNQILTVWGSNTMLLFILHVYTNNIAYIIVQKLKFGGWGLTFIISLFLLQIILSVKQKIGDRGVFKYV